MSKIKVGDYVTIIKSSHNIKKNSVGFVKGVKGNKLSVFFIGSNKMITINNNLLAKLDLSKTGKPYKIKICNACHILKKMDEFDVNQTDAKGRKTTRPSCKDCRKTIDGVSLLPSEKKRMDKIKPKDIFTCPICQKTSIVGITANLVRDHDHKTGKARAWICDSCNTGLGRFKDDTELLAAVIEYLKLD